MITACTTPNLGRGGHERSSDSGCLSPHAAERVASTILLHCLIHKPHRELKNFGLRHEVAIRAPVRLLLTVSLQDHMCVSDMALEASRAPQEKE